MRTGPILSSIFLVALLPGCKDKTASDVGQEPTGEAINVVEIPSTPEPAPQPDAQELAKLSEKALSIFLATDNSTKSLEWHLLGEQIALRAEATLSEGAKATYDAKLFAQVKGEEETELLSCKSLSAISQGRIDVVLRGDMLHALCINSAVAEDPGATDAKRYGFSLGKRVIEAAGSYGGDGSLDLDSIDLDEGE